MTDQHEFDAVARDADANPHTELSEEQQLQSRRGFLLGLGKWSSAVIVGAVAGGTLMPEQSAQAAAWINRRGGGVVRGGGWIDGRGGSGGGSWANRRGGGYGGSWVNRR
ncbi:hypothetical protein [Thiorhodovibrio frisius]|uniref:Uncharacterized protein n=1 Tax=Thiorhodovibrio frisius TaxID=631362 RepID=H8Z2C5_9GAMM|nr:hypothetical protein [Thiorhodovibrio frisius]EIC21580.1 hypothetical protein Thi970DRAFT_01795 [Thiorhodovibrio frisius]WPL21546.1 hypothetical protein Thiofri_01672 [Thiorhodovibrio frisius]